MKGQTPLNNMAYDLKAIFNFEYFLSVNTIDVYSKISSLSRLLFSVKQVLVIYIILC